MVVNRATGDVRRFLKAKKRVIFFDDLKYIWRERERETIWYTIWDVYIYVIR